KPNRGYFLERDHDTLADLRENIAPPSVDDIVTHSYFKLADELLRGALPMQCSETLLRARYGLSTAQTQALLARIAQEGWAERRPGYGWEFSSMLTTPDSLLQSYRLRLALEPAALLEPGFRIEKTVLARCRAAEKHLLDGGIRTDTADQLHERGVRFHES
ncbi:GntR family transcriptional regulator, partial [Pseudomonas aeruginosa]|nr:GntR family transcriptional regulator [Pseudomonas aeruginosa]